MEKKFNDLLEIIMKPIKKRNHKDIDQLASLLGTIKFFNERNLSFKDLHYVAQCLTYVYFEKDLPIINYGEVGDTFFIILKGSVGVLIPIKVEDEEGEIKTIMKDVATLDTGKSFGELALINNKPRLVI